jgi:error-prone DNA polymerase
MQRSGTSVLVAGIKVALQTPPVRSGRRVMFLTLDDGYGCNDITFFEDIQRSCANLLRTSSLFLVRGVLRRTGPRGVSIRASEVWDLPSLYEQYKLEKTQQIKELTKELTKEQSDDARVS